jgi:hypothetical protein
MSLAAGLIAGGATWLIIGYSIIDVLVGLGTFCAVTFEPPESRRGRSATK